MSSLDVRWTPSDADGDGQLPLSENYRKNLRKLCDMLRTNQALPNDIRKQRKTLEKECSKLQRDDNISSYNPVSFVGKRYLLFALLAGIGGGSLYWLWHNGKLSIANLGANLFSRKKYFVARERDDVLERKLAREARLKRFSENNSKDM